MHKGCLPSKYLLVSQCWCSHQIPAQTKSSLVPCRNYTTSFLLLFHLHLSLLGCTNQSGLSPWFCEHSELHPPAAWLKCSQACRRWGVCVQCRAAPEPGRAPGMIPIHLRGPCCQACTLHTFGHRAHSKAAGTMLSKIHFMFKVSVPSVSLWYLFLKGAVKLLCFYHSHSLI